jgi:prevent-host-death family protein
MLDSTIGAYDARAHFAELLERVARGDEITITRHGTPVARLVPVRQGSTPNDRRAAIARMRQISARNRLNGLRIKDLIAEGRR